MKAMAFGPIAPVRVQSHASVPSGMEQLAAEKVRTLLLRLAPEPVLSARVTLGVAADPAVGQAASAHATVDLNGRILRAEATGETMREAIDLMLIRLRVQLGRGARTWPARW
jgi:ribosome-associated translation inhibitor RaiA